MDARHESLPAVFQSLATKFPNYWRVTYRSLSPKISQNFLRKDQPPEYQNRNCFLNVSFVLEFLVNKNATPSAFVLWFHAKNPQ